MFTVARQSQWTDGFRATASLSGSRLRRAFANPHGSTGIVRDYNGKISGDYGGRVM